MFEDCLSGLGERIPLWQSADGRMAAGRLTLGAGEILYSHLGNRLVTLADIQALAEVLETHPAPGVPLLLLSNCPGFEADPQAEARGLVLEAGRYRALQQARKQAGGLILSYVWEIGVGGTYLMHGLAAQYRAGDPDARFHDTLPSRPAVPMNQVLARGLVDSLVSPTGLAGWLEVLTAGPHA
jgi:hypothetical protein